MEGFERADSLDTFDKYNSLTLHLENYQIDRVYFFLNIKVRFIGFAFMLMKKVRKKQKC